MLRSLLLLDWPLAVVFTDDTLNARLVLENLEHARLRFGHLVNQQTTALDVSLQTTTSTT